MSKPEIIIERKIHCGEYGFIVRESPDFPEGTEIVYRDQIDEDKNTNTSIVSLANLDDLDALIECLTAWRTELATRTVNG